MTLAGVYPIVPTPFDTSGSLDFPSIERLTSFLEDRGVQGVAILGVMGESHKLTGHEQEQVIEAFREHLPEGLQLVVGVRAAGTDIAVGMARTAAKYAPDALLVGPPPVQKDDTIFAYYKRIAEAVDVPLILHDYPAATGILMSPALIARLYKELDTVRYLKLEDPPTGLKMEKVRNLAGEDLKIFGALGGAYAFEELDRGAVGIMTGFGYPEFLVDLYERYQRGDIDGSAEVMYDISALIRWEFQPGLGVSMRKHILVKRGVFETAFVRHPGAEADAKTLEHLDRILGSLRARGYAV
jgi:4-hydroxy-tetrahydrodipicolinate synthase